MDFEILGRHLPERPSREVQFGQGHQAEHLRRIFEQPMITHLAIAELAFDNPEDLLDLGSNDPMFSVAFVAHVSLVAKDHSIIRADQIISQTRVMHLGHGGFDGVYQPAFGVHADMRLHLEIPLIAFLCLANTTAR